MTFTVSTDSPFIGRSIDWLKNRVEVLQASVVAIEFANQDTLTFLSDLPASTPVGSGDSIYVVCHAGAAKSLFQTLHLRLASTSKVVIAGGGNIGERLASKLCEDSRFKEIFLIELDHDRATYLQRNLRGCVVLEGDVTDKELLDSNYIDSADVFCAVTDDDEVNVLSSLLAKQIGVSNVLTLIKKQDYLDIVSKTDIDVAISPQQSTASAIFRHVGEVTPDLVQTLNDGSSYVIEISVKEGQKKTARSKVADLSLPKSARLVALRRGNDIIIGDSLNGVVFSENDHLVFLISNIKDVRKVELLFKIQPFY